MKEWVTYLSKSSNTMTNKKNGMKMKKKKQVKNERSFIFNEL